MGKIDCVNLQPLINEYVILNQTLTNLLDRKKEIVTLTETINSYDKKIAELTDLIESERKHENDLADDRDRQREKVTELEIAYNVLKTDRDHAAELVEADSGAAERYKSEIDNIS